MKTILGPANLLLILVVAAGLTLAACTTDQMVATVVGLSAGAQAILDAAAPLMSPEDFARLRNGVDAIDGDIGAAKSVLDAMVTAFAQFRDRAHDIAEVQANAVQALQVKTEGLATHGEVVGYSTAAGAGGTAVSRILSALKHGAGAVKTAPAKAVTPTA